MHAFAQLIKAKGHEVKETAKEDEIRLNCVSNECRKDSHRDYKLYVNLSTKQFFCHRCNVKGGFKGLLALLGMDGNTQTPTPSLEDLVSDISGKTKRINDNFESILPTDIKPAWSNRASRIYLRQRGIGKRDCERYGFMHCYGGYFSNRIILPVFDENGRYRTFAARYVGITDDTTIKKYLYPKDSKTSRILYGLHSNVRKKRSRYCIITEGIFDAIHLRPFGVACFGLSISDRHIKLLRQAGIERVCIIFDHDKKKRARQNVKAAIERNLNKLGKYFQATSVWLPEKGTDPNDYDKKQILKWVKQSFNGE